MAVPKEPSSLGATQWSTVPKPVGPPNPLMSGIASAALATELGDLLRERAGAQALLRALAAERERVSGARVARRRDRAVLRVVDPAAAEADRARRQQRKGASRKRKAEAARERSGKRPAGEAAARGGGGRGGGGRGRGLERGR